MTEQEQHRAQLHRLAMIARAVGDKAEEARLASEIWASAKQEAGRVR